MSHYCNVYGVAKNIVTFDIYNFLGHVDGHITVWLRVDNLRWCWAKMGDYATLTSIRPVADPVVRVPTEQDVALIWPRIVEMLRGTCYATGQFILPDDQSRADQEQREFDESPADSWERQYALTRRPTRGLGWGASRVFSGVVIEDATPRFEVCDLLRNLEASKILLDGSSESGDKKTVGELRVEPQPLAGI